MPPRLPTLAATLVLGAFLAACTGATEDDPAGAPTAPTAPTTTEAANEDGERSSAVGDDPRWDRRPSGTSTEPTDDEAPGDGAPVEDAPPSVAAPAEIVTLLTLPDGVTIGDTQRSETSTEEVVGLTGTFAPADLAAALGAFEHAFARAGLPISARDQGEDGASLIAILEGRTLGVSLVRDADQVFVSVDLLISRAS